MSAVLVMKLAAVLKGLSKAVAVALLVVATTAQVVTATVQVHVRVHVLHRYLLTVPPAFYCILATPAQYAPQVPGRTSLGNRRSRRYPLLHLQCNLTTSRLRPLQ